MKNLIMILSLFSLMSCSNNHRTSTNVCGTFVAQDKAKVLFSTQDTINNSVVTTIYMTYVSSIKVKDSTWICADRCVVIESTAKPIDIQKLLK